jgi:hypothetical protein
MTSRVYIGCSGIILGTSSVCLANTDFIGDFADFRQQHRKTEQVTLNIKTSKLGITTLHIDEEPEATNMFKL